MNITEIDDALSAALMALSAAQATLRKGASTRDLDVLRKADLDPPRASDTYDPAKRALGVLADAERRITALESAAVAEAAERARQAAKREAQ
jgi:hypothetical protein